MMWRKKGSVLDGAPPSPAFSDFGEVLENLLVPSGNYAPIDIHSFSGKARSSGREW
jgi:hypothetical protein